MFGWGRSIYGLFRNSGVWTYMEVGDVLPIQGLEDRELSGDRVDDEDAVRRLVSAGARHAVS